MLAQDVGTQGATYSLQMADVDGERARTLHRSTAPILSASWSPDGERVAYVSFETGRPSIIVQDVNGPKRERLTNFRGINGSPVFSPDGKQLAMVLSRSGDPEVFVMNLENRKLRRITRHPAIDTEPSWSPDGKYLIFTSDRGGKPQIYQLELATNFLERSPLLVITTREPAVAGRQTLGLRASAQRRVSYCLARFIGRPTIGIDRIGTG